MTRPDPGAGRRPGFRLPPLATDAHCHVFGPAARFPYAPDRRYTPEDAPKEMLAALHARLGIERAVIVQASCHGRDNAAMLDCLASNPGRYRGVAMVDAGVSKAELDLMHAAGVRGVRFNFVQHLGGAPDLATFRSVIDLIRPLGWHVVLHVDAPDIARLAPLIADLPVLSVLDHMGRCPAREGLDQAPFLALKRLLGENAHVWVKVSGAERIDDPPFRAAVPFARALMALVPDRIMWGTDYPHPNLKCEVDEADLVDLLPDFGDEAALMRLTVDNPARLYDF